MDDDIPVTQKISRVLGALRQQCRTKTKHLYFMMPHGDSKKPFIVLHLGSRRAGFREQGQMCLQLCQVSEGQHLGREPGALGGDFSCLCDPPAHQLHRMLGARLEAWSWRVEGRQEVQN